MTDIPLAVLAGQEPAAFITTSDIGRLSAADSKVVVSISRAWRGNMNCQGIYLRPQVTFIPDWIGDFLNRRSMVEAVLRKGEPLSADEMKSLAILLSVPTDYQTNFADKVETTATTTECRLSAEVDAAAIGEYVFDPVKSEMSAYLEAAIRRVEHTKTNWYPSWLVWLPGARLALAAYYKERGYVPVA